MPESLAPAQIDYLTGERSASGCSPDLIEVAVPAGTVLPAKAGCALPPEPGQASPGPLETLKAKASELLRHLAGH